MPREEAKIVVKEAKWFQNARQLQRQMLCMRGGGCMASKGATPGTPPLLLPKPEALANEPASSGVLGSVMQDVDGALDAEEEARTGILRELQLLDNKLVAALERGDIRLVRAAWLCELPKGQVLPSRQELEAIEEGIRGEAAAPLLRNEEAVALLRCADRRVAVLSHGWLTAGHCDPSAARLAVVAEALRGSPHLQALFWE